MQLLSVRDAGFRPYGKTVKGCDFSELLRAMEGTPLPVDVAYVPSEPALENLAVFSELRDRAFGGLPIQIGYCNGHNHLLNALEYHRSSEINIAATDMILMLGRQQDIDPDGFTYSTSRIEAFLVPAGTGVEIYATTLHYAPCGRDGNGFRVAVVLPRGTNRPFEAKDRSGENRLLAAENKWLIAHPDSGLGSRGAFLGLTGKNPSVGEAK